MMCILGFQHHCRRCGGLFCSSCTQQRMVLRGQGDSPVRICEPCKKLEEAARFEMRHGHKSRAGRGIFISGGCYSLFSCIEHIPIGTPIAILHGLASLQEAYAHFFNHFTYLALIRSLKIWLGCALTLTELETPLLPSNSKSPIAWSCLIARNICSLYFFVHFTYLALALKTW